jgi:type I restriction enzyme R subunit
VSPFSFLDREWPAVFDAATRAEAAAHADPRSACFYARRSLELALAWAYKHDPALKLPYQNRISALIHEPSFKQAAGEAVFSKARVIVALGNRAVHGPRAMPSEDALVAVRELFHVAFWLARTYGRVARLAPGLAFDAAALPNSSAMPAPAPAQSAAALQRLEAELRERDEALAQVHADKAALDDELTRLRAEVAAARRAAAAEADTHDYSEDETRHFFIDLLLKEAGWLLDPQPGRPASREFEVGGMPSSEGRGFVDYVLWGDDGKPLAVVEAKRTRRDARVGQQQARPYADCLERQFGQRPLIYYSNGYEHWLWDDSNDPPRAVQGFGKKDELAWLMQRRSLRKPLAAAAIDEAIAGRLLP